MSCGTLSARSPPSASGRSCAASTFSWNREALEANTTNREGPNEPSLQDPACPLRLPLQQECLGVFDEFLDAYQELHRVGAVHDAVVVGEGEVHHRAYLDLAVHRHGPILDLVHPQYRHLRDVEDRRRV